MRNETKVRTTGELSVFLEATGVLVFAASVFSLFSAKHILAILIIVAVPAAYVGAAYLIVRRSKREMMINIIDEEGVRNSYFGDVSCEMEWDEIGDFGVSEVKHGLYRGSYIYMSRVFVSGAVRKNIVKNYDPRVCIVFPCTDQVCRAVKNASHGMIDIK